MEEKMTLDFQPPNLRATEATFLYKVLSLGCFSFAIGNGLRYKTVVTANALLSLFTLPRTSRPENITTKDLQNGWVL